jgi:hypothetical protein
LPEQKPGIGDGLWPVLVVCSRLSVAAIQRRARRQSSGALAERLWRVSPEKLSSEENQVCTTRLRLCLFCKNREEKIDLEASRCFERKFKTSDAGSNDVVDGLAGRIRRRGRRRWEVCHSGRLLLVF